MKREGDPPEKNIPILYYILKKLFFLLSAYFIQRTSPSYQKYRGVKSQLMNVIANKNSQARGIMPEYSIAILSHYATYLVCVKNQ